MNTAEGASILTPADIHHIRTFIDDKYPDKPQSERREIVADAIRRIIDQQLPDFAEAVKKELTSRLVRRKLRGQSGGVVRSGDIFELCMELDVRDQRIARPLRSWVERKLDVSVGMSEFERVLRLVKPVRKEKPLLDAVARELNAPASVEAETIATSIDAGTMPVLRNLPSVQVLMAAVVIIMLLGGLLVSIWSLFHFNNGFGAMPVVSASSLKSQPSSGTHVENKVVVQSAASDVKTKPAAAAKAQSAPASKSTYKNELPQSLQYTDIEYGKLQSFLESRSSMLAKPKYMDAIIKAAKQYNIDPLLLFAITGQEQSFVKKDHSRAEEIANNPFNVYHSWQDFNTTIEESSMIAAKTVVNLSKNRPDNADPIDWINRKYAEDPNWSNGVTDILDMLEDIAA